MYVYIYIYITSSVARTVRRDVNNSSTWRLAYTRYCHHQYCMVHGIQKGVGKRPYIAQLSCNSIAIG